MKDILKPFLADQFISEIISSSLKFFSNTTFIFILIPNFLASLIPFKTLSIDTAPPRIPNPSLQISALFAIKRVD